MSQRYLLPALVVAALVGAAIAAFLLTRNGGDDSDSTAATIEPDLVEVVIGNPTRINPLFSSFNQVDSDLVSLVFAGLTRVGADGRVEGDLAERWDLSDDRLHYTFYLRENARWQDGERVTADDVVFTIQALQDPDFRGDRSLQIFWTQVTAEAIDSRTVRLSLEAPLGPFPALATIGILPAHLLAGLDAAALFEADFNQSPTGAGPYRLVRLDEGRALLAAHDGYHGGVPPVGAIELRFSPDAGAAVGLLESGQADTFMAPPGLSGSLIARLDAAQGLRLVAGQRSGFVVLYLNNTSRYFSDERVRQAAVLAIDRARVIEAVFAGSAAASASPVTLGSWAYSAEEDNLDYNPAEARRLLEEAGWQLGENGILRKSGVEMRFAIVTNDDPSREAAAEEIAAQLREVGIGATVNVSPTQQLLTDYLSPRLYDAALFAWDPGKDPDPYPAWHSSQRGPEGQNIANFSDIRADRLLEEARLASDEALRQDYYRQFQQVFQDAAASVVIGYPHLRYYVSDRVQGVELGLIYGLETRFSGVTNWTVEPE